MKTLVLFTFLGLISFNLRSFADNSFFEDVQFYNFQSPSTNENLNHTDSAKRANAVRLLGQSMQPAAFDILLSRNWLQENFNVKSEICFALGQVGLSKTLLDSYLNQTTQTVKNLLSQSLDEKSKLNCIVAVSRLEKTEVFTEYLINALAMINDEDLAADYLITLVYHIRAQSIQNPNQAVQYNQKLFEVIKKYTASALEKVRRNAAVVLGRFNFEESKSLAIQLLDDSNTEVQLAALNSLKRLEASNLTEILINKLNSPNLYVQFRALNILAQTKKLDLISIEMKKNIVLNGHYSVAQILIQNLETNSQESLDLIDLAIAQTKSLELKSTALLKLNQLASEKFQSLLPNLINSTDSSVLEAITSVSIDNKNFDILSQLVKKRNPRSLAKLSESLDKLEANLDFINQSASFLLDNAVNENINFVLPFLLKISDVKQKFDLLLKFLNKIPAKAAYDYIKEEILSNLKEATSTNNLYKEDLIKFLQDFLLKEKSEVIHNKIVDLLKSLDVQNVPNLKAIKIQRSPFRALTFSVNPKVVLTTTKGKITIELFADQAPVHVANFVGLVQTGYYTNNVWHRVVSDFVVQAGSLGETGYWDENKFELLSEITSVGHERGTLGMARSDKFDSGSTQIFIDHQFTPGLDGLYTAFGKVIEGMDVVDTIERGDKIISAEVLDVTIDHNN